VTILIWNKNASSKDRAETREFIVSQPTEEMAKMRALMDAAIKFPPDEGWAYDVDNVKVEELSQDELGDMIEEHRDRNKKEGEERIDKALADLEKKGVRLKRPNTE
jgi:hypothetical protein